MKIGMRKPSIKKSISARTTGRAKRAVKKAVIPGYGKKGSGWIKNPKKAAYNKVYNKTTFSVNDIAKTASSSKSKRYSAVSSNNAYQNEISAKCPNCGQSLKKSDVSDYYLCDNCKIRIQPDDVQEFSTTEQKKKNRGKTGCFKWICIILLIFIGISCLGNLFSSDSKDETQISSTEEATIQTEIETEIQTEESVSSEQTIQTEYIAQTEAPVIETEAPEIVVYITDTGSKYHRSSCRHLAKSKYEISLSDAIASGYGPCGTCHPPTQ